MNTETFKQAKELWDKLEYYENLKRQLWWLTSISITVHWLEYKEFPTEVLFQRGIKNNDIIQETFMYLQFKIQEQIDSINWQIESL